MSEIDWSWIHRC